MVNFPLWLVINDLAFTIPKISFPITKLSNQTNKLLVKILLLE